MQISSRFTIAIHLLTAVDYFKDQQKCTSNFLAGSIGVNPVIVRKILQQLKHANIVQVKRGDGGVQINRPLNNITFYDVFEAVNSIEGDHLFSFHEHPNSECPVGGNIHSILDDKLDIVQKSMEQSMKNITLADVRKDLEVKLDEQ